MTSKGPRDVVRIPLNCDGIPPELRVLNQWVAWMFLPPKKPGGKHRKVPIYPKTGGLASTTDAATWGTFDDAVECFRSRGLGGIGFVFAQGGGMSGTDLDECRDIETGAIEPWARQIIEDLNSYTEVSPTGTGVHVFTGGELPPGGHRKGHVEMYDSERFFTVTGVMVEGTPPTVEERTEVLARVHAALIAKRTKAKAPRARRTPTSPRSTAGGRPMTRRQRVKSSTTIPTTTRTRANRRRRVGSASQWAGRSRTVRFRSARRRRRMARGSRRCGWGTARRIRRKARRTSRCVRSWRSGPGRIRRASTRCSASPA